MTTVDEVVAAHAAIGEAQERYRELLREALKERGNQARIAEELGVTREKLRQDAMTDEEREAVRVADAARKAQTRELAKRAS
jgi:DNA-binding phage protein